MTNLQAIQSTVAGYPLSTDTFNRVLLDRGIPAAGAYVGKSAAFELATADMYMILVTSANVSEGGFSVSVSEKAALKKLADTIYTRHQDNATSTPAIRNASNRW
jgi:hypothetical protein